MINIVIKAGLLIFAVISLSGNSIYAQCCSAGNPLGSDLDFSNHGKKSLSAGLTYRYSLSDNVFKGSEKVDIGFVNKSDFNYTEFTINYAFTSKLSVRGEIGYFFNKTEYYNNGFNPARGSGIGDISLLFNYQLFQKSKFGIIAIGMGTKLPVGVFDQEANLVKLPINVQPSSGSYKLSFQMFQQKSFNVRTSFFSLASVEFAAWIHSKNFNWRYGNAYLLNTGFSYKPIPKLNTSLAARAEIRGRSYRDDMIIVDSSGSKVIYINPALNWKATPKISLNVGVLLPVYRYMNGIQLGNSLGTFLGLHFKF
jgi:hypothetical protein